MPNTTNSERPVFALGLVMTTIGVAIVLLPSAVEMDMMSGGYGLRFIGLFVALCGLVVAWFYQARARVLDRILAGQWILAQWTYDHDEYRRHMDKLYTLRSQDNRNLLKLTAIIMGVVYAGVFFVPLLRGEDILPLIFVLYFGLLAVLTLPAIGAPWLAHRRALRASEDALIAENGIYIYGSLNTWKQPFCELKRVALDTRGNRRSLEFDMRYLTRLGWIHYETTTVSVPIPAGQEEIAAKVARYFNDHTLRLSKAK